MRLLLDTHVFLWAITEDSRLSRKHRELYLDEASELVLSVASLWEILIKCGNGKLDVPKPAATYLAKQLDKNRISILSIQTHHLLELESLPPLHRDPFDRMIAAQARAEGIPVLSVDRALKGYGIKLL